MSEQKPKRILRRPQVQDRVGLTHSQIDRLEKSGEFPKRIKISMKCAGWLEHEVEDFIDRRVRLSRGESAAA